MLLCSAYIEYWSSWNLLSSGMGSNSKDGFVIYVVNWLGWRSFAEHYIKTNKFWKTIQTLTSRIEGSMPTFSMWKWQLTTELFPTDMFAKKTCDKFAKICRRTYPCISQLVATLSTLLNSNFTIHSGIQNNICHIIRHTWLLSVSKWVFTLQKIS